MNSFRPKLEDLTIEIQSDIASHLGLRLLLKKASILSALSYAMAGSLHLLYGRIEALMNEFTNPSHEFLDVFAFFFGLKRHGKTLASATVKFTGTTGKSVTKGALLSHTSGRTYTLCDSVSISDSGAGYGRVMAEAPGPNGTLTVADTLTLVEAVANVSPSVQVLADHLQPGLNEEDDAALRTRLFSHLRHPGQGGSESDYKNWAKSIPGLGNVWVYAKEQQVFLTFLTTDTDYPIPTSQHVEKVNAHILNQKPLGTRVKEDLPMMRSPSPKTSEWLNTVQDEICFCIEQSEKLAPRNDQFLRSLFSVTTQQPENVGRARSPNMTAWIVTSDHAEPVVEVWQMK